jgi:hypothetical protein
MSCRRSGELGSGVKDSIASFGDLDHFSTAKFAIFFKTMQLFPFFSIFWTLSRV